jgi:hypothetical protein
VTSVTIRGRRYQVTFPRRLPKDTVGDCSHPSARRKRIRVLRGLSEKLTLDTLIHECLHAADFDKKEEWANETATAIARLLWELGYRRVEDGAE